MAQATNFTIKDGASTPADTVFSNVQPAGGTLPAVYFARTKGPNPSSQPRIQISGKGGKKLREVLQTVMTPYFVTGTDGKVTVVDNCYTEIRHVLPDSVPDDVRAHHNAYVRNSLDVPQVAESGTTGYPPN